MRNKDFHLTHNAFRPAGECFPYMNCPAVHSISIALQISTLKEFGRKKYPIHSTPKLEVCQAADGPRISIIRFVEVEDGKAPEDQMDCHGHPLTKLKRRLGHRKLLTRFFSPQRQCHCQEVCPSLLLEDKSGSIKK